MVGNQLRIIFSIEILLGTEGMAVFLVELQVKGDDLVHRGIGGGKSPVLVAVAAVIAAEGTVCLSSRVFGLVQGHTAALTKFPVFHWNILLILGGAFSPASVLRIRLQT